MKPAKIWWFLIGILVIVLLLPTFLSISEINFGIFKLRLPQYTWTKPDSIPEYKDISSIINLSSAVSDSISSLNQSTLKTDTVDSATSTKIKPQHGIIRDSLKNIYQSIEYPPGADTVLYSFFRTLKNIQEQKSLVRILHYGDSQIEGDRITSYFRNQMQKQFGGDGIGMIPVVPLNSASISYVYDISDNWKRHSILNNHSAANNQNYGVLGSFFRFTDSGITTTEEKQGWIYLKYPNISYSKAFKFGRCKLIMSGNRFPVYIELKKKQKLLDADFYPPVKELKVIDWKVDTGARDLMISIKGKDSPDLYAISLDSQTGIAVDNIPLRGSSGLEFTQLFKSPYNKIIKILNVKLVIMQFGVNAASALAGNIGNYERAYLKQLNALHQSDPSLSIIVIGISDLSQNTTKGYVTHEAVEKIRDAQKRAAFAAGCAFWDSYSAMGGKNSMPSWVFAHPPLAQKDFIHFNPMGAKLIGEMFYRSVMKEYDKFLESTPY
jgi:hypothetical protein